MWNKINGNIPIPEDTEVLIFWKNKWGTGKAVAIFSARYHKPTWVPVGASGYEIEYDFDDDDVTHFAFLPDDPPQDD